jgi:hypothetical protein
MATTPRNIRFDDDLYNEMKAIAKRPLTASWHIQEACRLYLEKTQPVKVANPKEPTGLIVSKPKQVVAIAKPKIVRPTVIELANYFQELGSVTCNDDANSFFDHFESNGWKISGKAPMKCWKAAVRNWRKRKPQFVKPDDERNKGFVEQHTNKNWREGL